MLFSDCMISSASDMEKAIRAAGIIPFFRNGIPGFSVQDLTRPGYWFDDGDDVLGPWDWKIDCLLSGDIAYGKFLCGGKAAFATLPFYRELANLRRATTQPDDDGKRIMTRLLDQGSITIREIRSLLGVKKSAADAALSRLQHQCRVVTGVIERVYNGPDQTYKGWQVSTFCTPESLFLNDDALRTSHTPEQSHAFLSDHLLRISGGSLSPRQIQKLLK